MYVGQTLIALQCVSQLDHQNPMQYAGLVLRYKLRDDRHVRPTFKVRSPLSRATTAPLECLTIDQLATRLVCDALPQANQNAFKYYPSETLTRNKRLRCFALLCFALVSLALLSFALLALLSIALRAIALLCFACFALLCFTLLALFCVALLAPGQLLSYTVRTLIGRAC